MRGRSNGSDLERFGWCRMPRSSAKEMADLRETVFERDGYKCCWPGCIYTPNKYPLPDLPLQLAHLTHRGMGGSRERNTPDNCVTLCSVHHDCLDGRTGLGTLRFELNALLRAVVGIDQ